MKKAAIFFFALSLLAVGSAEIEPKRVTLLRAPQGGIQPQAAVDPDGVAHLIFYKGAAAGGDIFYARQNPGDQEFSPPVQVNSQPGSAIAIGTIRGAQLALGKNGRVHVVWNGGKGAAEPIINGKKATPLLYTRLTGDGKTFEPERNLITYAAGLDGGSSVAADTQGNVYVTWHAHPPGNTNREAGRAVFVARSTDEGKTFQREEPAIRTATGACGCCGMKALADASGAVYILYRAAGENVERDEVLLVSRGPGGEFEIASSHRWKAPTCPMSSAFLSASKEATFAAWETAGQIYSATIDPKTMRVSKPIAPAGGGGSRKHPVLIANDAGETLLAWTEGTGWAKGGALVWQLYGKDGKTVLERGRADGVPVWSLPTAFARTNGLFSIVY